MSVAKPKKSNCDEKKVRYGSYYLLSTINTEHRRNIKTFGIGCGSKLFRATLRVNFTKKILKIKIC